LNNALEEIHSELLPADKVCVINDLKSNVGPTMMVGDGMNDAPALATADVGISMGVSGSAVATETSHITLMSNDIRRIPQAIRLARRTHRIVLINIIFSIVTKAAILGLALAGHPLLWAAVLADVGTCLLVIFNSMVLLREKDNKVKKKKCCGSSKRKFNCKSEKSCAKPNCCNSETPAEHCHSHTHSHSHLHNHSPNCDEGKVKKEHSHSHTHSHSHNHSPNCNEGKVKKEHDQCFISCHDHGHAAETKPKPFHLNCCDEPAKVEGNTCQEQCQSNSPSYSHSHLYTHSEHHSHHRKEETKEKGNPCQGAPATCHDEIKKIVPERRGGTSLEGCRCGGAGSSRLEALEMRNGGCCSKSYREEVARREGHGNGCCENGMVILPEIIME
jgi:Zn2+/Cd2+-exporting ATPase